MTTPAPDVAHWLAALRAGVRLEINCPMCARAVALVATVDHGGDAIGIEPHRYTGPSVIAIGGRRGEPIPRELREAYDDGPRAYLARCPMSWQPLMRICDGEHAAPACSDPCCYHGEGDAQTRAFTSDAKEAHPSGCDVHHGEACSHEEGCPQ